MRISHAFIGVVTERIKECRVFYSSFLGFEVVLQLDWYVHLRAGSGAIDVAFLHPRHPTQPFPMRDPLKGGGVWISLEVEDARREQERLAMAGVSIVTPLRDEIWGERHFIIRDPAGVLLNIAQRIEPQEDYLVKLAAVPPDAAPIDLPSASSVIALTGAIANPPSASNTPGATEPAGLHTPPADIAQPSSPSTQAKLANPEVSGADAFDDVPHTEPPFDAEVETAAPDTNAPTNFSSPPMASVYPDEPTSVVESNNASETPAWPEATVAAIASPAQEVAAESTSTEPAPAPEFAELDLPTDEPQKLAGDVLVPPAPPIEHSIPWLIGDMPVATHATDFAANREIDDVPWDVASFPHFEGARASSAVEKAAPLDRPSVENAVLPVESLPEHREERFDSEVAPVDGAGDMSHQSAPETSQPVILPERIASLLSTDFDLKQPTTSQASEFLEPSNEEYQNAAESAEYGAPNDFAEIDAEEPESHPALGSDVNPLLYSDPNTSLEPEAVAGAEDLEAGRDDVELEVEPLPDALFDLESDEFGASGIAAADAKESSDPLVWRLDELEKFDRLEREWRQGEDDSWELDEMAPRSDSNDSESELTEPEAFELTDSEIDPAQRYTHEIETQDADSADSQGPIDAVVIEAEFVEVDGHRPDGESDVEELDRNAAYSAAEAVETVDAELVEISEPPHPVSEAWDEEPSPRVIAALNSPAAEAFSAETGANEVLPEVVDGPVSEDPMESETLSAPDSIESWDEPEISLILADDDDDEDGGDQVDEVAEAFAEEDSAREEFLPLDVAEESEPLVYPTSSEDALMSIDDPDPQTAWMPRTWMPEENAGPESDSSEGATLLPYPIADQDAEPSDGYEVIRLEDRAKELDEELYDVERESYQPRDSTDAPLEYPDETHELKPTLTADAATVAPDKHRTEIDGDATDDWNARMARFTQHWRGDANDGESESYPANPTEFAIKSQAPVEAVQQLEWTSQTLADPLIEPAAMDELPVDESPRPVGVEPALSAGEQSNNGIQDVAEPMGDAHAATLPAEMYPAGMHHEELHEAVMHGEQLHQEGVDAEAEHQDEEDADLARRAHLNRPMLFDELDEWRL